MYTKVFQLHANFLKALAHPRRLEIIQLLQEQELVVSDIYTMLDLPQANISQHLTILREAKVVSTRRNGKQIYYQLTDSRILTACQLIRELILDQHQAQSWVQQSIDLQKLVPLMTDPVCHMRVSTKTASFHTEFEGQHFYFCASGCLKAFSENPYQYLKKTTT